MELATGAFGTILKKLAQLLEGECKLQKNVRKNIEFLKKELEFTHADLRRVGEVPPEELKDKEVVRLWAHDARELSYDMEDVVDTFLVHVEGPDPPSRKRSKRFVQKMKSMLAIGKRHQIGEQMEEIKKRAMEVAERRDRYKILSYSYYDMPPLLRTCLLYLSVFPEDYEINKDRLIRLWIAEGFIQYEKQEESLFEIGESYFNELITRRMIQPMYDEFTDEIKSCCLHDMVLDLVRSLSREENFVTILGETDNTSASTTVRRLSLQNGEEDHGSTWGGRSMAQVRSLVVFSPVINQIPALQSFKVLRVLDLEDCDLSEGYSLKYLGSLFHLRYLSLRLTWIDQLPKEVENLQFLEILDVFGTNISHLSLNAARLIHLLSLVLDWRTIVLNGIWSLRSLEELVKLRIDDESTDYMEQLGLLTKLRVLRIVLHTDKWNDKLAESLSNLRKIHTLVIEKRGHGRNIGGLEAWDAPRHLRHMNTREACWFTRLPAWMKDPSHLLYLFKLSIAVREIQQEDLEILGRLPALHSLHLEVDHEDLGIHGRFVICAGLFPCLASCALRGFVWPVVFQQEAAPRLRRPEFQFYVRKVREIAGSDGGFDLGLEHLPSLEEVYVDLRSGGASKEEVEEAKAAVRKAAEVHPNQPKLQIYEWKPRFVDE